MQEQINARDKYEKKRFTKRVSFNMITEKDIYEYSNSIEFSSWAKQKLREELNKKNSSSSVYVESHERWNASQTVKWGNGRIKPF